MKSRWTGLIFYLPPSLQVPEFHQSHCSQGCLPKKSLVGMRSCRVPLLIVFSVSWRKSYHQYIPGTSRIAYVLVFSVQQNSGAECGGWSPPWGPGPSNTRVCSCLSVEKLLHLFFLVRWPLADLIHWHTHIPLCTHEENTCLNGIPGLSAPDCTAKLNTKLFMYWSMKSHNNILRSIWKVIFFIYRW